MFKESKKVSVPLVLVDCAGAGGPQGRDRALGSRGWSWGLGLRALMWRYFNIWQVIELANGPSLNISPKCGLGLTRDWPWGRQQAFLMQFELYFIRLLTMSASALDTPAALPFSPSHLRFWTQSGPTDLQWTCPAGSHILGLSPFIHYQPPPQVISLILTSHTCNPNQPLTCSHQLPSSAPSVS